MCNMPCRRWLEQAVEPGVSATQFYLLERCDTTLSELAFRVSLPRPVGLLLTVAADIIEGLHFLTSEHVAHLDLTVTNVLVKCLDGQPRAVLADFGISHVFDDDDDDMCIPFAEPFPVRRRRRLGVGAASGGAQPGPIC